MSGRLTPKLPMYLSDRIRIHARRRALCYCTVVLLLLCIYIQSIHNNKTRPGSRATLLKEEEKGGGCRQGCPPLYPCTHMKKCKRNEWVDPCHIGIGRLGTRRDPVWGKLHTYSDEPRTCRSRVPNQSRIPGSQGGSPWHVASQYTYAQNLSEDTRSYSCNVPH